MKTSEYAKTLGFYLTTCCGVEQIFDGADCFSRCPHCEQRCEWELIEALISWQDFDKIEIEEELQTA